VEAVTERKGDGDGNREKSRQIHRYEVSALILEGLCYSGEAPCSMVDCKNTSSSDVYHCWCSGRAMSRV